MKWGLATLALVAALWAGPASADTCTGYTAGYWVPGYVWYTVYGPLWIDGYWVPGSPYTYYCDPGITLMVDGGGSVYLQQGTFVKINGQMTIYEVYGGQFHAFSTWGQFLGRGGQPDLSNVRTFNSIRNMDIGAPIT